MMLWKYELLLLLRARAALAGLLLLTLLTVCSLVSGQHTIDAQRDNIARIAALQQEDDAAVADYVARSNAAGSAAYYSFHPTWDMPSPLAFAVVGMRDVSPYILRVRALGLEAQIFDGDSYNPELALAGRFDYAFVLVFLLPLFVIALLFDLRSGEREAGRACMLAALPGAGTALLVRRVVVRAAAVLVCLSVPFAVAATLNAVPLLQQLAVLALSCVYLLFWVLLAAGRACHCIGDLLGGAGLGGTGVCTCSHQSGGAGQSRHRDRAAAARGGQPCLGYPACGNHAGVLYEESAMGRFGATDQRVPLQVVFRFPRKRRSTGGAAGRSVSPRIAATRSAGATRRQRIAAGCVAGSVDAPGGHRSASAVGLSRSHPRLSPGVAGVLLRLSIPRPAIYARRLRARATIRCDG